MFLVALKVLLTAIENTAEKTARRTARRVAERAIQMILPVAALPLHHQPSQVHNNSAP